MNQRLTQTPYNSFSHAADIMSCEPSLHNTFVAAVKRRNLLSAGASQLPRLKSYKRPRARTGILLLYKRFNISNSLPVLHLLREGALCTIGIVLHTKIFVDLEQTLLVGDAFQELIPARIVSEKASRSRFESAVR